MDEPTSTSLPPAPPLPNHKPKKVDGDFVKPAPSGPVNASAAPRPGRRGSSQGMMKKKSHDKKGKENGPGLANGAATTSSNRPGSNNLKKSQPPSSATTTSTITSAYNQSIICDSDDDMAVEERHLMAKVRLLRHSIEGLNPRLWLDEENNDSKKPPVSAKPQPVGEGGDMCSPEWSACPSSCQEDDSSTWGPDEPLFLRPSGAADLQVPSSGLRPPKEKGATSGTTDVVVPTTTTTATNTTEEKEDMEVPSSPQMSEIGIQAGLETKEEGIQVQMVVEKKMEPTIVIIHEDSPYHLKAFVMGGVMTVLLMGMAFGYILAVGHYGQYHSGLLFPYLSNTNTTAMSPHRHYTTLFSTSSPYTPGSGFIPSLPQKEVVMVVEEPKKPRLPLPLPTSSSPRIYNLMELVEGAVSADGGGSGGGGFVFPKRCDDMPLFHLVWKKAKRLAEKMTERDPICLAMEQDRKKNGDNPPVGHGGLSTGGMDGGGNGGFAGHVKRLFAKLTERDPMCLAKEEEEARAV